MSAEVKSMKEWALYYAELGLAVFPLAYRNKVPAIEGGCKAATTEKSKIERWWNQNPRYNIGIATGNKSNGLVVIDLDVDKNKGIDGYEVLRDWQNKHGELPETWQSITGRGGYHYFYKDTITHSNKVGLYEGVDIRGEGRYKSVIRKLAEKHPEDCQIIADNEDGSICAHVPVSWLRISPPRQYTEEQRQQMGERLRQNRSENTATQG